MRHSRHFAIAFAMLVSSAALSGAGAEPGGLSGVVLNATCPGPCSTPPLPLPTYAGDDLTIVIRRLPDRQLVARLYPTDGHFGLETGPGRYRVRAFIGKAGEPSCWRGSTRRRFVVEGMITPVRLRVRNLCVL